MLTRQIFGLFFSVAEEKFRQSQTEFSKMTWLKSFETCLQNLHLSEQKSRKVSVILRQIFLFDFNLHISAVFMSCSSQHEKKSLLLLC